MVKHTMAYGACDVLVVGGGNAALCAALAARRAGAEVMLVERAPYAWRGGNSKYTRNLRCVHDEDPVMPGRYTVEELSMDLEAVTGEGSDRQLTDMAIERSRDAPAFLESNGALWQPALRGTLQLGRTNRFFLGGGKALLNALYATAEKLGIRIAYEHSVEALEFDGDRCTGVQVETANGSVSLRPAAVVAASGGFEANLGWLREYWGEAADNFFVRGARQNDGTVLRRLLDAGAAECGNRRGFHGVAVDARGPRHEGGIVTRVDSVPFSVMVNREGHRFYDEGEDLWPKRYATWGRLIAEQPGQIAYSIFDSRVRTKFMSTAFPPYEADTLEELADQLGLERETLVATVGEYNDAVREGACDTTVLDDCHTEGLTPPKSHWALPVDRPPFLAYPLRTGVTFTYLGVGVDENARVRRRDGGAFSNVFAAGEVMAGNILLRGYLAGFGMTLGTVFGQIAGEQAAICAR
jgi:tricarballylate dehydrogenase